jgi:hypothetical protein
VLDLIQVCLQVLVGVLKFLQLKRRHNQLLGLGGEDLQLAGYDAMSC